AGVGDGEAAAWGLFADRPRPGALEALGRLRALGLTRQVLLSGDDQGNVESIASALGLEEAAGDLRPEEKAQYVTRLQSEGARVLMVGDGINDAPALSTAAVGMALAAHGGGIAAESADVVLLDPAPERVVESVEIGRRTMRIARQSLGVGLGLSLVAMGVAAMGHLPPVPGALLQEGIDLAVILNALRSATPGGGLASAGGQGLT
ncbi:MAG: HAD-IC family P-type ATPase, partial [Gemmatimonadota bacterium]